MLQVNMLLQFDNDEKSVERVLWFNVAEDLLVTVNIYDKTLPIINSYSKIEDMINNDVISVTKIDPYLIVDRSMFSKKALRNADDAWVMIKDLVRKEPDIYIALTRKKIIKEVIDTLEIKETTLIWYLLKYWKRGMIKDALLTSRTLSRIKRKRKSNNFIVDEEVEKIFTIALKKYYYTKRGNSITNAYHLMLKDYFSDRDKSDKPLLNVSYPTLRQFRYFFEKTRDVKHEIVSRKGSINYLLNSRGVIGSAQQGVYGPGYFEIDATITDLYIVSDYDFTRIIGRAVLYFCIDTYSKVIVGFNLGLNAPSWEEATLALYNAFTTKVDFCKQYDITITDDEWPFGIPTNILADKGEFEGYFPSNLVEGLGIIMQNTSTKRGDYKSHVEKSFDVLQRDYLKPFADGYVDPKRQTRQTKDYRRDANITLKQLNKIIIKYILFHNNHHYLKGYERDLEMIADDVKRIPNSLWKYGIERYGKLRVINDDLLKLNLMQQKFISVTAKGIKLFNLYYTSQRSIREDWFSKARVNGSWKLNVVYDSRNMNHIYIRDEGGRSFEKCTLVDHQHMYKDLSYVELQHIVKNEKQDLKEYEKEEIQKKMELFSEIESIANEARDRARQTSITKSDSVKIKEIKVNKEVEKILINDEKRLEIKEDNEEKEGRVLPMESFKNDCEEDMLINGLKKRLKSNE